MQAGRKPARLRPAGQAPLAERSVSRALTVSGTGRCGHGLRTEGKVGIEDGGDLTPDGRGATDPGLSSPSEPSRLPADPFGPAEAQAPVPTGLAGGPSPAAWGWTPSTPPTYWSGGDGTPPRARPPIVATVLALCVAITFPLPWVTFDAFGISVSLSDMFGASDWIGRLWADLVVFGFLLALISAFFDAFLRLGRRAAIAEALGFGAVGAGTVIGMASRFDSYFGDPGFGAWLCLLVAAAGVIAAVVRFASPNAFTSTVPPYVPAHHAPPFAPEHPGVWAPPYLSTPSGSTPYVAPVPAMPRALVSETAGQAPDLSGAPGTLAVLVDGQTATRLVQPGELLVIGRDPDSGIVLADPQVSPRHASIERRGPGWLVRGLDVANPTWLLDATGRAQPIRGELGLRSGELLIGGAQVRLFPPSR